MKKNIVVIALKNSAFNKAENDFFEVEENFYNDIEIKINLNDYFEIGFIALDFNLESLALGYFKSFNIDITKINVSDNVIFAKTALSKQEAIFRLEQKNIIQSCESIMLNDNKTSSTNIIIPFNASRFSISASKLQEISSFFSQKSEILSSRILLKQDLENLQNNHNILEMQECSAKAMIYKLIGKAIQVKIKEQGDENQIGQIENDLLDSMILLDCNLEIDILKIIILNRITFIVSNKKPSFMILKYAQKFGITLIYYNGIDFRILTHNLRIK